MENDSSAPVFDNTSPDIAQAFAAYRADPSTVPIIEIDSLPKGLMETSDIPDESLPADDTEQAMPEVCKPEQDEEQEARNAAPDLSVLGTVHRVTPARQAKTDKVKHQKSEKRKPAHDNSPPPRSFSLRDAKAQDYLQKLLKRNLGEDGEDHVNTASAATTHLGKLLQINAYSPFEHPDLGPFKSLGGLWYYVSTGCEDELFRGLSGYACHSRGQGVPFREIEGFKFIMAEAAWIKVRQNRNLQAMMYHNELPYKHYTLVGETRVRQTPSIAAWYVPIIEEIARIVKLNAGGEEIHQPDFSFLENVEPVVYKERRSYFTPHRHNYNNPMHP